MERQAREENKWNGMEFVGFSWRQWNGMNETPPQGAQRPAASPNKQTQSFFARSSAMKRLNLLICSACSARFSLSFSFSSLLPPTPSNESNWEIHLIGLLEWSEGCLCGGYGPEAISAEELHFVKLFFSLHFVFFGLMSLMKEKERKNSWNEIKTNQSGMSWVE